MTHIQRAWTIAAALAGALSVCAIVLLTTTFAASSPAPQPALAVVFAVASCTLFAFALQEARHP